METYERGDMNEMESQELNVSTDRKLNELNFSHSILQFRDRQAGVSAIYDPELDLFTYNAYCLETKLLTELYSCEFEFLEDALQLIHEEFGNWELFDLSAKSGCGSCAAKGAN